MGAPRVHQKRQEAPEDLLDTGNDHDLKARHLGGALAELECVEFLPGPDGNPSLLQRVPKLFVMLGSHTELLTSGIDDHDVGRLKGGGGLEVQDFRNARGDVRHHVVQVIPHLLGGPGA